MIRVGMQFHGYCSGAFGRDAYSDKRVEAFGADWIVVRDGRGKPIIATFDTPEEMESSVTQWRKEDL